MVYRVFSGVPGFSISTKVGGDLGNNTLYRQVSVGPSEELEAAEATVDDATQNDAEEKRMREALQRQEPQITESLP